VLDGRTQQTVAGSDRNENFFVERGKIAEEGVWLPPEVFCCGAFKQVGGRPKVGQSGSSLPFPVGREAAREVVAMAEQTKLRVRIDREKCQGHARCFALAPELFELDELGNGRVRGDGTVAPELEEKAYLARANCPEFAIEVIEEESP
jgi:ferredoxin